MCVLHLQTHFSLDQPHSNAQELHVASDYCIGQRSYSARLFRVWPMDQGSQRHLGAGYKGRTLDPTLDLWN